MLRRGSTRRCCSGHAKRARGRDDVHERGAGGYLEVLQWAHQNECPWDEVTCALRHEGHLYVRRVRVPVGWKDVRLGGEEPPEAAVGA